MNRPTPKSISFFSPEIPKRLVRMFASCEGWGFQGEGSMHIDLSPWLFSDDPQGNLTSLSGPGQSVTTHDHWSASSGVVG